MNTDGFIAFQKTVAIDLESELESINFKEYRIVYAEMDVEEIHKQQESIRKLFSDSGNLQRLNESPLLNNAGLLPYEVPLGHCFAYATEIFEAITGYLNSGLNWEAYFREKEESITKIWGTCARWEAIFREEQRLAKEAERVAQEQREKEFQHNLEVIKARFRMPEREAPCFATTRKNGLNCNRNTLVLLVKLPPYSAPEKEVDILVHRCSECWQLYKEFSERDLTTKHCRDRFLKPGETDAVLGLSFSLSEMEQFSKIDFASIVYPILKEGKDKGL